MWQVIAFAQVVHDDGPRCGGAASPDAISYGCLDENEERTYKSQRDGGEYGERVVYCTKCGLEPPWD